MAVRAVKKSRIHPDDVALADRLRRAMPQGRDVSGVCHEELCTLARRHGKEPSDLIDEWDHRSAVREYDGNVTRGEAESLALDDIKRRLEPQGELL